MNKTSLAIAAAQDPILDEIVRLERQVETLKAMVEALAGKLEQFAAAAEPGPPGPAGIGIDAPAWESRVYREGAIVQHYQGQYFKALQDTAAEPGDSPEWKRIGFAGIRWRGELVPGMQLQPGDHYREEASLFLVDHTCTPRLLNHRGERGPRGKAGPPGHAPEAAPKVDIDELRAVIEAMLVDHVLREILPTIREIGERLVALERGRP